MRKSNYRRPSFMNGTVLKWLAGILAALCVVGLIAFFSYFRVEEIEVRGSTHYSDEEVRRMVLKGPMAGNSVLAPIFCTRNKVEDVFFVDAFTVTRLSRNTICISVIEKKAVGCISFLDSYISFDRNGVFIEGSRIRDEKLPYLQGIQVSHVVEDEKLPIRDATFLNTAVALSTIFLKNQMLPESVDFDDTGQISLLYGDIIVRLGKDEFLEDKMARVIAILPQLEGRQGILHLEGVNASNKRITFEEGDFSGEAEEEAILWTGGYDEFGIYNGIGEYDEKGEHVGPRPEAKKEKTEADDEDAEDSGEEDSDEDSEGNSVWEDPYDEAYYDSLYDFDAMYQDAYGYE